MIFELPHKVGVVSCQFLVQRAFSTEVKAKIFAKNVYRVLKPGGFFIVSLTNAETIKDLIRSSTDRLSTGNGVFSVELEAPSVEPCPEFGINMLFRVDDKIFSECLVRKTSVRDYSGQS